MTRTAREAGSRGIGREAGLFLFGLVLAILAAAYASHVRLATLDQWRADPAAHFAGGVPAMTTHDAYYNLRLAAAVRNGTFVPHADDPLRHYERLQYPVDASEFRPGSAPLDWRPQRTPRRLPLLAAAIAAVAPLAGSVEQAGLYLTPLLAGLFVVPLFLCAWRLGYPAAGLLGGLVGAFAPIYFARTQPGYVDTDCLNLFFPWLAALAIVSIDRDARPARVLATAAALGVTLFVWYRWYDKPALSALYWGALALHLALQRRGAGWIALAVAVCIACSHPIQAALCVDNVAGLLARYFGGSRPADGLSAADALFPNVMITIAELQGRHGLAALDGVLGDPAPAILGVLAFAAFATFRWRQCVALLPLIAMAAFTFTSGSRFSMYLAPLAGLGLGVLLTEVVRRALAMLPSGGTDGLPDLAAPRTVIASHVVAVLAFALWLGPIAARAVPPGAPAIPVPAIRALQVVAFRMPAGAPVWTWWDHGFAYAHLAGWTVFHDGAAQYTPQTHVIAHSFVDSSQRALHATMANVDRAGNKGIAALAAKRRSRDALLAALATSTPDTPPARALFVVFTRDMIDSASAMRFVAGLPARDADGTALYFEPLGCTGLHDNVLRCRGFEADLNTGNLGAGRAVRRLDIVDNGIVVKRIDYPRATGGVLEIVVGSDRRIEAFVAPEEIYRSNLNRMFVLGEYDHDLFEEVHREVPVMRVFRRRTTTVAAQ